ncbi:hypothetical protein PBRA_004860 [Plasmodiophora brassicae]|uniref:Serine aminopeptidase S33 domain-containing protein n=1 Tax=Plasmodiophora brassicae TaxID=37360 RepID=A0A0G4IM42_PLABS|nr:hypothetical protein PBRA_004860 [Plasmodiophora brassicae]
MTLPSMQTAVVGSSRSPVTIAYNVVGDDNDATKARVLLIMGLGTPGVMWQTTAEHLAANGFCCVFYDNRGVGHSSCPMLGYSIRAMAEDALGLVRHLKWDDGKVPLVAAGISMGGMILQELLLLAPPSTFAAAAFVSTHAGMTVPPVTTVYKVLQLVMRRRPISPEEHTAGFMSLLFTQEWLQSPSRHDSTITNLEFTTPIFTEMIASRPPQALAGAMGHITAVTTHFFPWYKLQKLKALDIPYLVMTGSHDTLTIFHRRQLVRPSNSHYIAKHLGAPLEVFDQAGHSIEVEDPERYYSLLVDLFSRGFERWKSFECADDPAHSA